MDQGQFESELRAQGYDAPVSIERDSSYALGVHSHPFDACALVTHGAIAIVVDGQLTTYGAGDVFVLPAGTEHTEHAGPQGVRYLSGRRYGVKDQ